MQHKTAMQLTGVTRHQYYHKPTSGRRGRPLTQHTNRLADGLIVRVPDSEVVAHIHELKNDEDTDHGYQKTAHLLMLLGYYIGPKKTYRLFKQEGLLAPRRKAAKRAFVKYRVVTPERPLHVLEMDIKSKWLTGERRSGYILTILDTFTRQTLHWQAGLSMTQHQVTQAWDHVIRRHLQPADLLNKKLHVEVRNDNGPQFIANMVQDYFKKNHLDQVFTHPYTPQENGHVESFHAILGACLDRHTLWDLDGLLAVLTGFYKGYNTKRIHGSTAYLWPDLFEQAWHAGLIQRTVDARHRVHFKLLVPYQELLSGCRNLQEGSCLILKGSHATMQIAIPPSGEAGLAYTEGSAGKSGALQTPSVTQSPLEVSC